MTCKINYNSDACFEDLRETKLRVVEHFDKFIIYMRKINGSLQPYMYILFADSGLKFEGDFLSTLTGISNIYPANILH